MFLTYFKRSERSYYSIHSSNNNRERAEWLGALFVQQAVKAGKFGAAFIVREHDGDRQDAPEKLTPNGEPFTRT